MAAEIISEGTVTCTQSPMAAHGLEGYVKGMPYRYQKIRGPNGAEWFRVYPDPASPSYYEVCGERVFFAYFKINRLEIPIEAYDVDDEDLEAAADMCEKLRKGTFYDEHEAAVRWLKDRSS